MAQKKRRRKPARSQADEPYPGWMWMLFGLTIGLSVAVAIYMKDRGSAPGTVAQAPASMAPPPVAAPAGAASSPPAVSPQDEPAEEEEPRFSFYNMLPNFEVIIPEEEPDVRRDTRAAAVERPGTYVLQAGSFTTPADADRRRAELALLGVESRVQTVSIDRRTYYRVRIGPLNDLAELNRIRDRLKTANIDALRIRLGD